MPGETELTLAALAAAVGVEATHIAEMERGQRPIGKDMAKRLAEVPKVNYQVFLYNWPKQLFKSRRRRAPATPEFVVVVCGWLNPPGFSFPSSAPP